VSIMRHLERFERIEATMERFATGMEELRTAHVELEGPQLNTAKALERLTALVQEIGEKQANQAILIDRLIERDLGRSNGGR